MEELLDCVWGCGLPRGHDPHDRRCPPGGENWANGPDKALGTDRQLRGDIAALRGLLTSDESFDEKCSRFIRRRLAVIGSELDRRGRVTA